VKYPTGDLLDRASISLLKLIKTGEPQLLEEVGTYLLELSVRTKEHPELAKYFQDLFEINSEIWTYESDLREGKLGNYKSSDQLKQASTSDLKSLAAVGLAAIKIRNANKKRKTKMNGIVELVGDGWKDIKVNHASE